jgi:hypothetical protein
VGWWINGIQSNMGQQGKFKLLMKRIIAWLFSEQTALLSCVAIEQKRISAQMEAIERKQDHILRAVADMATKQVRINTLATNMGDLCAGLEHKMRTFEAVQREVLAALPVGGAAISAGFPKPVQQKDTAWPR